MLPLPALIQKRELEQRPHVRPFARQRDERRHVRHVVLDVLAVGVEVNRPVVPPDPERVARNVLPRAHPFGQGVALDREIVGAVHRLDYRSRARRRVVVVEIVLVHDHGSGEIGRAKTLTPKVGRWGEDY